MAMKKVTIKKATVKKPVMKRGGTKKPLRKAQNGIQQGPLSEEDTKALNSFFNFAMQDPRMYETYNTPSKQQQRKKGFEANIRKSKNFNTSKNANPFPTTGSAVEWKGVPYLKKGGPIKNSSKKVVSKTVKKRK